MFSSELINEYMKINILSISDIFPDALLKTQINFNIDN